MSKILFLMLAARLLLVASEHLFCSVCLPGTYCFEDEKFQCPLHSMSSQQSGHIQNCTCLDGYRYVSAVDSTLNFTCTPCGENVYCTGNELFNCPDKSISLPFSSSVQDCLCEAGYSITEDGECSPCPAGTFKTVQNNQPCTDCPADKYSTTIGATSASNCLSCPQFSSSPPGSSILTNCTCNDQYEAWGFQCVPACNDFSSRAQEGGNCQCDPGYEGDDGTAPLYVTSCVACEPGHFKSERGDSNCNPCPESTFAPNSNTIQCQDCPDFSFSEEGSISQSDCKCRAGYEKVNGACSPCQAGHFKGFVGDDLCQPCEAGSVSAEGAVFCNPCAENYYQHEAGKSTCFECVANSSSFAGSAGCQCNAGFEPECQDCTVFLAASDPPLLTPEASCSPCKIGYFKNIIYNQDCVVCSPGKYTLETASENVDSCITCNGFTEDTAEGRVCSSCPENSAALAGSTSIYSCKCNAAFTGPNGGECTACSPGTFKSSAGSALCQNCPAGKIDRGSVLVRNTEDSTCRDCEAGKYSLSNIACQSCPSNTNSPVASADVSACICNIDYEKVNGACAQCSPGYVKTVTGNQLCTACLPGTFDLNNACESCPTNSSSPEASAAISACTCIPGHTGNDGSACASCEAGKFKPTTGSASCTACGPGTYYSGTAPYIFNHCVNCPTHSESPEASYLIDHCTCNPGYIREQDNTCRDCQAGFYCPNQITETPCNEGSSSAPTSTTSNDCICSPGFVGPRNNCVRCPVDNYCSGDASQIACPQHSTTVTVGGKSSIADCICNPGFYENNHQCIICEVDHWCFNDEIIDCPANSSALQQQGQQGKCICNEFFRKDETVDNHCVLCGDDLVCHGSVDGLTDGVIEHCSLERPNHPASSNVNQRCVCPAGTYCDDGLSTDSCSASGDECNNCPENSYCFNNQRTSCIPNAISPANSYNESQCQCKPGYYRSLNNDCVVCPVGSFCTDEVRTDCTTFDSKLTTASIGSSDRDQCICSTGFFRFNNSALCLLCPLDVYCPSESDMLLPNVAMCQPNEYTDQRGSHLKTQCVCLAGFFLSEDSGAAACLPCARGERCGGGTVIEEGCHIENRTANIDHTSCVCMAGFQENQNIQCEECPPGFFKDVYGNHDCSLCPDGSYSFNTTHCLPCRADSSSSPDRLSCPCNAPLQLQNDVCVLCDTDQFYENGCQDCPQHSSTLGDPGEPGITSCHCNSGYVFSIDSCQPCPETTYEKDGICQSCGDNAWSPEASVSSDACQCNASTCQKFVFGNNCSGACEVQPDACSMCDIGYNKSFVSAIGNTDVCEVCPLNTFQNEEGQALCKDCDATRMTPLTGRTQLNECLCREGFEGGNADVSATCSECSLGHFKASHGNNLCDRCLVASFADTTQSTTCVLCSVYSSSPGATLGANTTVNDASISGDDCVCDLGRFQNTADVNNLFCEPCHRGSYKTEKGMQTCDLCGIGIFIHTFGQDETGAVSSSHCQDCPSHSGQLASEVSLVSLMNEITDCQCFPGHDTWTSSSCVSCEDFKFKLGFNNLPCEYCSDGQYFIEHNQACGNCDLIDATDSQRRHTMQAVNTGDSSLRWGQDELDCVCDLGFFRITDSCHQCTAGSYRNETEVLTCTPCAIDTYQDESAALGCKFCPENSHTVATGSSSITDCRCDAGYELHSTEHRCIPCTAGTYAPHSSNVCQQCVENTYSLDLAAICTPCAANERSQAGSSQEGFCNCLPGFGSNLTHPSVCTQCPLDTYSTGGIPISNQRPACTSCPDFKSSPLQSSSASHCVCVPGYEDTGSDPLAACTPCINGQYSLGGVNQACKLCGFGSVTEPPSAATSFSDCLCSAEDGLYLPPPQQWVLGEPDVHCATVCANIGLQCDAAAQTLTGEEELKSAFAQVGIDCGQHVQFSRFPPAPFFMPNSQTTPCFGVFDDGGAGTSTCDESWAYAGDGHQALCRCV